LKLKATWVLLIAILIFAPSILLIIDENLESNKIFVIMSVFGT